MVVAKRQGRETPAENRTKKGQRKVWGLEWELQVEQTAHLASPICIGQAQEDGKTYKKRSQRALSLSFSLSHKLAHSSTLHVFGLAYHHASRVDSPAIF